MIRQPGGEITAIRRGKPHIARVWYPKSQRHYWRVSRIPINIPLNREQRQLWDLAHAECQRRNDAIDREFYRIAE